MELDDILDQMVTIMTIALFLLIMMPQMIKITKSDYGGFGTQIEKTALKTDKSLSPYTRTFKRENIMMMLAVTDEYEPEPKRVNIDGLIVDMNESFLQNRIPVLRSVNEKLPKDYNLPEESRAKYKLEVIPGDTNIKEWKFTKIS